MLDGLPLTNLPNGKTVERQLMAFFEHIYKGENSPDSVYEAALMKIPAFVTGILAVYMRRKIKKIYVARGIDISQPSPYSNDDLSTKDRLEPKLR